MLEMTHFLSGVPSIAINFDVLVHLTSGQGCGHTFASSTTSSDFFFEVKRRSGWKDGKAAVVHKDILVSVLVASNLGSTGKAFQAKIKVGTVSTSNSQAWDVFLAIITEKLFNALGFKGRIKLASDLPLKPLVQLGYT